MCEIKQLWTEKGRVEVGEGSFCYHRCFFVVWQDFQSLQIVDAEFEWQSDVCLITKHVENSHLHVRELISLDLVGSFGDII